MLGYEFIYLLKCPCSLIGGPAELWNLFPQSPNFNRGIGSQSILQEWAPLENEIARELRARSASSVAYNVQFTYQRNNPRPSYVAVTAEFLDARRSLIKRVQAKFNNDDIPILGGRAIPRRSTG